MLSCLADDRTFKVIAVDLGVSINTVLTWAKRAYPKLGVDNRYDAVHNHRNLIRRGHYCEHLRVRDRLITGWEFRHQAVT